MAKRPAWPSKRIRAFSSAKTGKSGKAFDLKSVYWRFPQHANAFKLAGDMVIDAYDGARRVPHHDELFFPVAYLYRHYKADPDGQTLRYDRDKAERELNRPGKMPHVVWLRTLRRTMDGVYNLLDTCEQLMCDERRYD